MNAQPASEPDPPPFPCPECGATDQWKADYYEAVWQECTVVAAGGEPNVTDYAGCYAAYDDASTENESIKCQGCGHEIVFARFVLVPPVDLEALKAECGYHEDPDHENGEGSVDDLIAYKDALEDLVGRLSA